MKLFLLIVGIVCSGSLLAQTTTETIKVAGNCGTCKKKIETAAKIPGVNSAVWNKKTKELALVYDASKTTSEKVQASIANAGYDTEKVKASDAAYNKLDECCQYDRKKD
ncbi:MAG: cation transporter [Chitinophagaceae bacterium]